jgi:hypothetical protein
MNVTISNRTLAGATHTAGAGLTIVALSLFAEPGQESFAAGCQSLRRAGRRRLVPLALRVC